MKHTKRLLAAIMLFFGMSMIFATPALAAGCVEPVISSPASGLPGQFDAGPAPKPASGDPDYAAKLAEHKRVLEHPANDYERYGWGGLAWQSYDPDECDFWSTSLNDVSISDTGASFVSNAMWNTLVATTAAATSIVRWAFNPDTLGYLKSIQQLGADVFGNVVFKSLFFVTLMVTGVYVISKAAAGNVRGAANSLGWVLLVTVAALLATAYPTSIGPKVDQTATGIVSAVSTAVSSYGSQQDVPKTGMADSLAENLRGGLLYETWLSGTFGRSDGYAAKKYGPELYKAAALTRAEQQQIDKDPTKAEGIFKDHAEKYDETVKKMKDDDRVDRETVKSVIGKKKNDQVLAAALAWVGFWCLMLFVLVASFLMLFGLIVVRVALILLPALAVLGGFPPLRKTLTGLFDYVLGALAAAVLFGSFAMVMAFAIGKMLGPPAPGESRPPWLVTMILMVVLTAAAWKMSKPMRHVKTFVNMRPTAAARRLVGQPGQPQPAGAPNGWTGEETQRRTAPTAQPYGGSAPAEASTRKVMGKAAVAGAVQGAIGGLAAAAVTGGTSSIAGAATGAARGAAVSAAGAGTAKVTGSAALGAAAATAAGRGARGLGQAPAPALPAGTTPAVSASTAPAESAAPMPAQPVDQDPVRVYTPDESIPSETLTPARIAVEDGVPVYSIFTPED